MTVLCLILLLLSVVFFGLAAFNVVVRRDVNFVALGLMCWVLVSLLRTIQVL